MVSDFGAHFWPEAKKEVCSEPIYNKVPAQSFVLWIVEAIIRENAFLIYSHVSNKAKSFINILTSPIRTYVKKWKKYKTDCQHIAIFSNIHRHLKYPM